MGETTSGKHEFLISLTAFTAMNMFRAVKKDKQNVFQHMPTSGTNSYNSLFGAVLKMKIPPPAPEYVDLFAAHFPGNGQKTRAFLAMFVSAWIKHNAYSSMLGVLKASGMLALSENGLGLISWTYKAATKCNVDLGDLLSTCLLNESFFSQVRKLLKFLKGEANQGKTWPWCRLFVDTALAEYSTKRNLDPCAVCAWIELDFDEEVVKGLLQFSEKKGALTHMKETAYAVFRELKPLVTTKVGPEKAKRVAMSLSSGKYRDVMAKTTMVPVSTTRADEPFRRQFPREIRSRNVRETREEDSESELIIEGQS